MPNIRYHVYGSSKPVMRHFTSEGKYKELKFNHSSGHAVFETITDAIKLIQDYQKRGWDAQLEAEQI